MKISLFILLYILADTVLLSQEITTITPSKNGSNDYRSIAIAPNGTMVIAGNGVLLASKNNEIDFTKSHSLKTVFSGIVCSANNSFISVATNGGIYRSTDNAVTWNSVFTQKYSLNGVYADKNIAVAIGEYGVILLSEDNGATWKSVQRKTTEHLNGVWIKDNSIYCVGNGGVFVHSTDLGKTWSAMERVIPDDIRCICFGSGSVAYAGTTSGTIYEVRNSGKEWKTILTDTLFSFQHCTYQNNTYLFTGGYGAYYSSDNTGVQWKKNSIAGLSEWINAAIMRDNVLYCIGDKGIVYHNNNNTWTSLSTLNEIHDMYWIHADDNTIWSGGQNGNAYISEDNGNTWKNRSLQNKRHSIFYTSGTNVMHVFTTDGYQVQSSDKGISWTEKNITNSVIYTGYRQNNRTILGGKTFIAYSDNDDTWTNGSYTFKDEIIYGIGGNSQSGLCAVGKKGIVLVSANNGVSWSSVQSSTDKTLYTVAYMNNEEAVAAGEKGTVLYSQDGGNSWTKIAVDTVTWRKIVPDYARNRFMLISLEGIIYAGKQNTWQKRTESDNYMFNAHVQGNSLWICGTEGYIGAMSLLSSSVDDETPLSEISIVYNSGRDAVLVNNLSDESIDAELFSGVGSSTGQRISLADHSSGEIAVSLASGIYYCLIHRVNKTEIQRVIIIR